MSAADFDVFLAFAGRARRTHLVVHIAARTDNRGISHASGYFPRKPGSRCGCRNITFSVHGHAGDCAGGRVRNDALGVSDLFLIAVKERGHMLFPFRRIDSGPPVERRFGFPGEPDFPRMLREEIHFFKALGNGEPARSIAHNHRVIGVFHYRFCQPRDIFDPPHRSHCAGAVRGTVHDAGIEFHFAFFIGQAAVADGVVVGIVLYNRNRCDHRIERVPAFLEDVHALIKCMQPVSTGNDERTLAWCGRSKVRQRQRSISVQRRAAKELVRSGKGAASQRSDEKFPT